MTFTEEPQNTGRTTRTWGTSLRCRWPSDT